MQRLRHRPSSELQRDSAGIPNSLNSLKSVTVLPNVKVSNVSAVAPPNGSDLQMHGEVSDSGVNQQSRDRSSRLGVGLGLHEVPRKLKDFQALRCKNELFAVAIQAYYIALLTIILTSTRVGN